MNTVQTFFTAFCRKRCQSQKEIAVTLGFSQSYISAIMSGRRPMTDSFRERLVDQYKLSKQEKDVLAGLPYCDYQRVVIPLKNQPPGKKVVAAQFAAAFYTLTDEQIDAIRKVLEEES